MVVHVVAAPYWFRWPEQKPKAANDMCSGIRPGWRVMATLFVVAWCIFAAHQVGGWCTASPSQLAWRCATLRRMMAVLDRHKVRWHPTKSTLMEALRDGLQGHPSLSTFDADEDLCVHDEDYERACRYVQEEMRDWPGAVFRGNVMREKGALARNFISLARASTYNCSIMSEEEFKSEDRQGMRMVHIPCHSSGALPAEEAGEGLTLRIPKNSEAYLRNAYGPSWSTPIIEWGSTRVALHDFGCNIANDHAWPHLTWMSDTWTVVLSGMLLLLYTYWWLCVLLEQRRYFEDKSSGGNVGGCRGQVFIRAGCLSQQGVPWRERQRKFLVGAAFFIVVYLLIVMIRFRWFHDSFKRAKIMKMMK